MKRNQKTENEAFGKMYFKNNHFLLLKEPPRNDLKWAYQLYRSTKWFKLNTILAIIILNL